MLISATTRVAAKIIAKQKYAKTASEWRKKNPDKIKAQKKRYYAAHKERLIKEQKQWRKDNPEKAIQLMQAANERRPKPVHTKKQSHFIKWNKKIKTVNTRNLKSDSWGVRSDAGIKRGSYRLQEFTSKRTTSKYPSEQEQWREVMSSRDVVGSSMFSSFLKGFGKTKQQIPLKPIGPDQLKTVGVKSDGTIPKSGSSAFVLNTIDAYTAYKNKIMKATKGYEHLSLKARAEIAKDIKLTKKVKPSLVLVSSSIKGKKRKRTLKELRKFNWNRMWLESHPTHKKIVSIGGILGGLAAYANWNRGEDRS